MNIRSFIEKIRSLPTKQLVALVIAVIVVLSVILNLLTKEEKRTETPSVLHSVGSDTLATSFEKDKEKPVDEGIKEVKEEEKKILAEKGRYFGEVQGKPHENKKEKKDDETLLKPPQPPSDEELNSLARQLHETARQNTENLKYKAMVDVFNTFYNAKITHGELLGKETKAQTKETDTSPNLDVDVRGFQYWKFYRGVVRETVSNARFSKIPIEVEITEAPLKGCLVLAKGEVVKTMDRITADIEALVCDGTSYKVNGTVFSVDYTRGVASRAVLHETMQAEADFLMKGLSTALETARSDESETVVDAFGGTHTTEKKAEDRTREALLQGGSDAIEELKTHIDKHFSRYPPVEVIIDRDTPVYVRFER